MATFQDRLEKAFAQEQARRLDEGLPRLTKTDIWKAAGASSGAATHWFNGSNGMDLKTCTLVAPVLNVDPLWLYDESRPMKSTLMNDLGPSIKSTLRPVQLISNADEAEHELLQIPRYTLRASAGMGAPVFEICKEEEPNFFRASWAKRRGLEPERLFAMHAAGDSMEPEICDGDTLTVYKQSQIEYGKLMVICYMEECYVKRLLLQFDRSVVVKSSNPAYRDIHIPAMDVRHIHVVGRVVNISHDE